MRGLARGETGEASGREGDGPRVGAEGGDDGVDRRRTENETARFERRGGVGALETRTREWATAHLANIPRVRVVHGARPTVRRAAPARSPVRDRARCAMKGEAVDGQRSRRARSERSSRLISPFVPACAGWQQARPDEKRRISALVPVRVSSDPSPRAQSWVASVMSDASAPSRGRPPAPGGIQTSAIVVATLLAFTGAPPPLAPPRTHFSSSHRR